jgi:hypothetical protein
LIPFPISLFIPHKDPIMAIVPIRDLGKYGVITDLDPYDLPAQAWSMGVNVRFRNNHVTRGPVFRNAAQLANVDPRFLVGAAPSTGLDFVFVCYKDGTVYRFQNGSGVAYSISGYTPASAEALWTSTTLANVVYINRPDRVPWSFGPSDSAFNELANWDSTWRAQLLRTCGGSLVALNVTKGAVNFPQMVKTSSFPLAGAVPASWDITLPNTLATENIIAEMSGGIIDAQKLGSALVIYGEQEAWLMQADGSTEVFSYRKLPFNKGAINGNCTIEIDGKHYVFGTDDLWTHDGYSETSICDGQTRDFIFNAINASKANRCFVSHNPRLKELHFCYVSGDGYATFLNSVNGCNRSAVYNYSTKTWSFDDLPCVFSADNINLDITLEYATATSSYDAIGGTYLDQEDGFKRTLCFVGEENAPYGLSTSLYAFDLYGAGSTVSFPVDIFATAPVTLEKNGMDLDDLGKDLRGYICLSSIYPQARFDPDTFAPMTVSMGSNDFFTLDPIYDEQQTFDSLTDYKLDYQSSGRYLAVKLIYPDYHPFSISGFDLDLNVYAEY